MITFNKAQLLVYAFVLGTVLLVWELEYGSQLHQSLQYKAQTWKCSCNNWTVSNRRGGGDDLLKTMRADGWEPRLLSRAVPRPFDNDTTHVVPNVVHYVLYGVPKDVTFDLQHYLSFRSVTQFMKPQYIFLHGDVTPKTEWWNRTLAEVDNLYHVYREKQTHIHGKKVIYVEHLADFTRLEVTITYGGIYLDTDTLIMKSLDPLRGHALTLGVSGPDEISNAIIIAQRDALFLRMWLENYNNYVPGIWGHNSVTFGHRLYQLFPHLVHVEKERLLRPTWKETELIYSTRGELYDWSENYSFHVSGEHTFRVPKTIEQLKRYNNTLGQVMRYIYFGSLRLLPVPGAPFTPE